MPASRPSGPLAVALAVAALAIAACGGGSSSSNVAAQRAATSPAALDARSAATGDIPDSQVYLTFHDVEAGYSIQYPEGWTRQGAGGDIRFVEKGNSIHVVLAPGPAPTLASVAAGVARLAPLKAGAPRSISARHGPAILVSYSVRGTADAVTGKVPVLQVDRYVYARAGRVATLDLASPTGVDNVDAYKLIGQGFQWR